jgi:hypothetical protein
LGADPKGQCAYLITCEGPEAAFSGVCGLLLEAETIAKEYALVTILQLGKGCTSLLGPHPIALYKRFEGRGGLKNHDNLARNIISTIRIAAATSDAPCIINEMAEKAIQEFVDYLHSTGVNLGPLPPR